MPSNADLIKSIEAEATEKGVDVPDTKDLKNDQLAALLSDLKKSEAEAVEVIEAPEYTVATGKSITSKRGILSDGDEVFATDFSGGKETLEAFIKSKHIV